MSTTGRVRNRDLPVELMFHQITLAQSTVSRERKIFQRMQGDEWSASKRKIKPLCAPTIILAHTREKDLSDHINDQCVRAQPCRKDKVNAATGGFPALSSCYSWGSCLFATPKPKTNAGTFLQNTSRLTSWGLCSSSARCVLDLTLLPFLGKTEK